MKYDKIVACWYLKIKRKKLVPVPFLFYLVRVPANKGTL